MIEPVEIRQIAQAALLSGAIIFCGAGYAVFYALAQLRQRRDFFGYACVFYSALALSVLALAVVLHLNGLWALLVVALLLGYLVAPMFIWRLSVDVHGAEAAMHSPHEREREP